MLEYKIVENESIFEIMHTEKMQNGYHGRHSEVPEVHFLCQPVHLPPGVAKDDSLWTDLGQK